MEIIDLPETILFPGLVNAHCHLELSNLPEKIAYPGTFVGWVAELSQQKLQLTETDYQRAFKEGSAKLLQSGTTTVADHVSPGMDPSPLFETPLSGILFLEVLGVSQTRVEETLQQARKIQEKLKSRSQQFQTILTPHAPYSLLPLVFRNLCEQETPLSIHLAESADEFLLFKEQRGPFYEFLSQKGAAPSTQGETPVAYLARQKLLPNRCMAIHANYLEDEDVEILAQKEISVIHCPGSHDYFDHDRFLYGQLEDAGINIALGTDSLASNDDLNMLKEMQLCLESYPELTPEQVLRMATLNGARALHLEKEIGSITPSKWANIVGVRLHSSKQNPIENILLNNQASFVLAKGKLWPPKV